MIALTKSTNRIIICKFSKYFLKNKFIFAEAIDEK